MFGKIWESHVVFQEPDCPALLYIDLHLVHEVTSPQAFAGLREKGLRVRRPSKTVATVDHIVPTTDRSLPIVDPQAVELIAQLEANCRAHGIELHGLESPHQGIVHVIGPELGATQPGMTVVCGDSHTATHGAFGALAFGIGTSEVEHVRDFEPAVANIVQALPGFFLKTPTQQQANRGWCFNRQRIPVGFASHNGGDAVRDRGGAECLAAREHLIEHAAEGPDVAALVHRLAARLLRRHVGRRSQNHARARGRRADCASRKSRTI
jgi:hypothetical protein